MSDQPQTDQPQSAQDVWVTLYCEQIAEVKVRATPGASPQQLRELALRGLDASGGAEWFTRAAWTEHVAWREQDRLSDEDLYGRSAPPRFDPNAALRTEQTVRPVRDHSPDAPHSEGR